MIKKLTTLLIIILSVFHAYAQDQAVIDDTIDQFIPVITLDQLDESDDEESTYSVLNASRDAFESAITFTLGRYRYRFRGYDGRYSDFYLNHMPVNDLVSGWFSFGNLGGVSNVLFSNTSLGLESNSLGTAGVGGLQSIDIRASNQRKQFRGTYSYTNGSYNHRLMATYSTGVLPKNWAISMSVNKRWSTEGYIDGTFYDSYGYYFGVEKLIKEKHRVGLSLIGNASKRGRSSAATQELYDLAGSNFYNSYWGYQEGKKRNSRVSNQHQPMLFLTYEWNKNNTGKFIYRMSNFSQFGRTGSTALDWYDATDPRPDYYRNLPSWQEDDDLAAAVAQDIYDDPLQLQLDWNQMYQANYNSNETVENANGIEGNTVVGKQAKYLIEERRYDNLRFGHSSSFEWAAADKITVQGGVNWQRQQTHYYKLVEDLLGADFLLDINKFADRDFDVNVTPDVLQQDLNNPNRIVEEGDIFGYDYDAVVCETGGWMQSMFTFNKVDFFVAAALSNNHFYRDGKFKNGLFPDNSEGKSEKHNFIQYQFKGGATYKATGKHYLYANASYETKAPTFRDAFLSPRTRNTVISGLESEKIISVEGGYLMKGDDFKARAVFYYTSFKDKLKNVNFYNDVERTFGNYSMTNISTNHLGAELMFEANIIPGLTASVVGVFGLHRFSGRPLATITQDNDAFIFEENQVIYSDNYFLGGHQQNAATLGFDYRSPKFWRVGIDVNYLNGVWIEVSPPRRTLDAVELVEYESEQWNNILDQEKTDNAVTLDLNGGYSWKMNKTVNGMKQNWFMYLNIGLSNVLNKKDIATGGYEQYRFDYENNDPETFPRKYYYAYGMTAYMNLSFRL